MVATKVGWHVLVKAEAAKGGARRAAFTRICHPTTIGHRGRRLACIHRRTLGATRILDRRTRSLCAICWRVYAAGNRKNSGASIPIRTGRGRSRKPAQRIRCRRTAARTEGQPPLSPACSDAAQCRGRRTDKAASRPCPLRPGAAAAGSRSAASTARCASSPARLSDPLTVKHNACSCPTSPEPIDAIATMPTKRSINDFAASARR